MSGLFLDIGPGGVPLWMPILGASMMALMMGSMIWMMWAMMRGGGHMGHEEPPPQPPADELSTLRDEVARLRQKLEEIAPGSTQGADSGAGEEGR